MAIIKNWIPPSRENWNMFMIVWQTFPIFASLQYLTTWYGMGKTSVKSRFNIPGHIGWATMEIPGFVTLLYIMRTLPAELGIKQLPLENWFMAGLFTVHYLYRAILAPLVLNPSMAPIHPLVWLFAFIFQISNAVSIGGWLAGHGAPLTSTAWSPHRFRILAGTAIWGLGLSQNIYHDGILRQLKRDSMQKQARDAKEQGKEVDEVKKVYLLPARGMFKQILYPHYLWEWVEWAGFWVVGGWACLPAQCFVVNEVASMFPRAWSGKKWYIDKFGKDKVGNRKAVIPGLI